MSCQVFAYFCLCVKLWTACDPLPCFILSKRCCRQLKSQLVLSRRFECNRSLAKVGKDVFGSKPCYYHAIFCPLDGSMYLRVKLRDYKLYLYDQAFLHRHINKENVITQPHSLCPQQNLIQFETFLIFFATNAVFRICNGFQMRFYITVSTIDCIQRERSFRQAKPVIIGLQVAQQVVNIGLQPQCDQMTNLFVQYLPIYNIEQQSHKSFAKVGSKF